MLMQVTLVDGR